MTTTRRKALARVRNMIRYYEAQGYILPKDDIANWTTQRLRKATGRELKKLSTVTPPSVIAKQKEIEEKYRISEQKRVIARTLASMRGKGYHVPSSQELRHLATGKVYDIVKAVYSEVGYYTTETGVKIPYKEWEKFLALRREANRISKLLGEKKESNMSSLRFTDYTYFQHHLQGVQRRASMEWREQRQVTARENYLAALKEYVDVSGGDTRALRYYNKVQSMSASEIAGLIRWIHDNPAIPSITGANVFYLGNWGTYGLKVVFEHLGLPYDDDTEAWNNDEEMQQ